MKPRHPSRYKLLTWVVAVIVGIVVADLFFPTAGTAANLLLAAAVAAVVALAMAWLGARRGGD